MKRLSFVLLIFSCNLTSCAGVRPDSDSRPVDHSAWTALLQKHVDEQGMVDYRGFVKDSLALNEYLDTLGEHLPNEKFWTKNERLAYWINAYNAFTIRLIIRHYPVKSIKDIAGNIPLINTPWDIKFIRIEGKAYDLNAIEHDIIRPQFREPRIHFALVCAAMGCPRLRREAYTAVNLNEQLDEATRDFFNDADKNPIRPDKAVISPILKWYAEDFEYASPSISEFINRYSNVKINTGVKIEFGDYDWSLNDRDG